MKPSYYKIKECPNCDSDMKYIKGQSQSSNCDSCGLSVSICRLSTQNKYDLCIYSYPNGHPESGNKNEIWTGWVKYTDIDNWDGKIILFSKHVIRHKDGEYKDVVEVPDLVKEILKECFDWCNSVELNMNLNSNKKPE